MNFLIWVPRVKAATPSLELSFQFSAIRREIAVRWSNLVPPKCQSPGNWKDCAFPKSCTVGTNPWQPLFPPVYIGLILQRTAVRERMVRMLQPHEVQETSLVIVSSTLFSKEAFSYDQSIIIKLSHSDAIWFIWDKNEHSLYFYQTNELRIHP